MRVRVPPRHGLRYLGLSLLAAVLSSAQERPRFPTHVDLVTLDVVVLDKKGEPVEGLRATDFVVSEDGRAQAVLYFESVALPESSAPASGALRSRVATNEARSERVFFVVFDNANMTQANVERAKDAVTGFLASGLRGGDQVTVVPTGGGAWWTARMPEGAADVAAFLRRLKGLRVLDTTSAYISDYEAMRLYLHRDQRIGAQVIRRFYEAGVIPDALPVRAQRALDLGEGHPLIRAKAAEVYQSAAARVSATLKALERAAESLANARGRKALLLVSEGFVHDPSMAGFRELTQAARRANAAIYFLAAPLSAGLSLASSAERGVALQEQDVPELAARQDLEVQGAQSVALDSGGFAVKTPDLAEAMRRIARESRSYYLIGYQPANTRRDGRFRQIKVEVPGHDYQVRARKGYYALADEARRSKTDGMAPEIRSRLDSPFDEDGISLRLSSYVVRPASADKATVLFAAEVDPRTLAMRERGGRFEGAIETAFLVSARDTGESFHQERRFDLSLPPEVRAGLEKTGIPVVRDFELPPGTYQVRLLVRDAGSGQAGTLRHEFEVQDPRRFQVSTPILTDTLLPSQGGSGPPRPVPIARRRFAAGTRVFYVYEVWGSRNVTAGYSVRRADGSVLTRRDLAPLTPGPQGDISQMVALSLQGASPGEYEIVLNVRDEVSGQLLEVRDPFTVVAP